MATRRPPVDLGRALVEALLTNERINQNLIDLVAPSIWSGVAACARHGASHALASHVIELEPTTWPLSSTNAVGAGNRIGVWSARTQQDQVRTVSAGSVHGVRFVSGRMDTVSICLEQPLDSVAGFLDVVRHEHGRGAVILPAHDGTSLRCATHLRKAQES